jgi:hypothetical protein
MLSIFNACRNSLFSVSIERESINNKTGKHSKDIACGITCE